MINFRNRDFETIKDALIKDIPNYTDEWLDTNESDASMLYVNVLAGISAMLNFYIDKQCNEAYINLAKEPKNIISILELLGYKRPLRVPARATQVFEVLANNYEDSQISKINIPKYTQLYSSDQRMAFLLMDSITITGNQTKVEAPIIQGVLHEYSYRGSDITSYKFYLPTLGVCEQDFTLTVNGIEWEKCDNAFLKYEGGRYYSLHRDAYDSHYILFSHDYTNYISEGDDIYIRLISTEGNISVEPRTVINLPDSSGGLYTYVSTYNKDYFTGGYTDSDVLLDRAKIQAGCKVLDKLVRLEDYDNYLRAYPGIQDAKCIDFSVSGFFDIKPYQIIAYIIPDTLSPMSDAFKEKLNNDLREKQTYSNSVILKDGIPHNFDVQLEYSTRSTYVNDSELSKSIVNTITDLYSDIEFSHNLLREEIFSRVLADYPEVYSLNIVQPSENYAVSPGEYIHLDTVTVTKKVM